MKNSKYEITNIRKDGLYRIRAVRDFANIKEGTLGGFIENESNLSEFGNCWIYRNATVCKNAKVSGDAIIGGNAYVCDNAVIYDYAKVYGNTHIGDDAYIGDNARVYENATVYRHSCIKDNAKICGNAVISDYATIKGNAKIYGHADIRGSIIIENGKHTEMPILISGSAQNVMWSGKKGYIRIGCAHKSIREWYLKGKTLAEIHNYTEKQIEEYTLYFETVKHWMIKNKKM